SSFGVFPWQFCGAKLHIVTGWNVGFANALSRAIHDEAFALPHSQSIRFVATICYIGRSIHLSPFHRF
ncbi:MAG: hypothetical protein R6V13_05795, partial [Anaerolineae bacterium]